MAPPFLPARPRQLNWRVGNRVMKYVGCFGCIFFETRFKIHWIFLVQASVANSALSLNTLLPFWPVFLVVYAYSVLLPGSSRKNLFNEASELKHCMNAAKYAPGRKAFNSPWLMHSKGERLQSGHIERGISTVNLRKALSLLDCMHAVA